LWRLFGRKLSFGGLTERVGGLGIAQHYYYKNIKMHLTLARMSIFLLLSWFSLFTSFSVLLTWLNRQHLQCVVPCDLTTVSESAASKLHTDTILKTIVKTTMVLSFFLLILHFTVNLDTVDLRAHKELDLAHR